MISAEPFEDWQGLLSEGRGTLRNAGEQPSMIVHDLLCQDYMTGMKQLPLNKLFTSLRDTTNVDFTI